MHFYSLHFYLIFMLVKGFKHFIFLFCLIEKKKSSPVFKISNDKVHYWDYSNFYLLLLSMTCYSICMFSCLSYLLWSLSIQKHSSKITLWIVLSLLSLYSNPTLLLVGKCFAVKCVYWKVHSANQMWVQVPTQSLISL